MNKTSIDIGTGSKERPISFFSWENWDWLQFCFGLQPKTYSTSINLEKLAFCAKAGTTCLSENSLGDFENKVLGNYQWHTLDISKTYL